VSREYEQDLRRNVLAMLFDLLELQTYSTVRAELISILENFIPYLLSAADFRSVAYILREIKIVLQRARELLPEHRIALRGLPGRLSDADALSQLLQSLDEAAVHPSEEDLGALFAELQAEALRTLASWLPRLSSDRVRKLVRAAAERLAQANPAEVVKALGSDDPSAQLEIVRLAGRLRLLAATEAIGTLLETGERSVKLAVTEALMAIASPTAVRFLERGIDDAERDVRVACVKFLGFRGHRNAFPRIEAAVMGGKLRGTDLTEKIAFFEAYGALAGVSGIAPLERMLLGRGGLLARREDPQTRACAAMALGKIRTAEARSVLEQALQDKEILVRNAVGRALREGAA
jgi:HEAT repeat protein